MDFDQIFKRDEVEFDCPNAGKDFLFPTGYRRTKKGREAVFVKAQLRRVYFDSFTCYFMGVGIIDPDGIAIEVRANLEEIREV